jgi:hypothetical protein
MMIKRLAVGSVGIVVAALLLLNTVTVATAAVDGELSAEYDADASTDTPGREIVVSGTLEVTGESAVNPRINVQAASGTVLDADTVEVFVEGSRAVDFQRQVRPNAVAYTADEIPSGTTLEVRYVVYPKGTNRTNVTAGSIEFQFASSGARQAQGFSATSDLSNSPQARVPQLEERVSELEERLGANWRLRFFALLGVAVFGLAGTVWVLRDTGGGPPGGSDSSPGGSGGPPGSNN